MHRPARRLLTVLSAVTAVAAVTLVVPAGPVHAAAGPVKPYDFDGDGHPEMVIAEPFATVDGHANSGEVVVIPGISVGHGNAGAAVWSLDTPGIPGTAGSHSSGFGYVFASGDINGDGYADLAVGAPNVAMRGHAGVGSVTIVFGSAAGLTFHGSARLTPSFFGRQNSGGTYFGTALAVGDLNGDGFADIAVGAPGLAAQYVATFTGGRHGVVATSGDVRVITQSTAGIPGTRHAPNYGAFGQFVTMGDFNGDGRDDLVIDDPADLVDRNFSIGSVTVIPGVHTSLGTATTGAVRLSLDSAGIPGSPTPFRTKTDGADAFGITMATGDVDADGYDDLIVGVPGHNAPGHLDTGAVLRLYGSKSGITAARSGFLTANYARGRYKSGEGFGSTVAIANVLGTSRPQVWVAAQFANYVVQLLPHASNPRVITQNSPNIPDTTEKSDNFGACLRPLDADGDGVDSLYIGAYGEDNAAGAVTLVSADVASAARPLSGELFKLGLHGLPGVHEANSFGGNC